jgi:DNA-binding response OmpR family regulator
VNTNDLMRVVDPRPSTSQTNLLRFHIHRIRVQIGYDCIRTVWGRGYLLTEKGRRVYSNLELVAK